jgi:hypothetical protein
MLSEFYHLRRTTIKDLAAYCGFLIGFLGSAPLAWPQLSAQIDRGNLVLGLWYFFGLVAAAAVAMGIVGLGAGFVIGWLWERFHRYRRSRRLEGAGSSSSAPIPIDLAPGSPRLQLIGAERRSSPDLIGQRLNSVRFLAHTVEFEFAGSVIGVSGDASIVAGGTRIAYPEAGSRDALCRLIGSIVNDMRRTSGGDIELDLDTGWGLVLPRAKAIVRARSQ